MAETRKLGFGPIAAPAGGVLIVLADDNLRFGPRTRAVLGSVTDLIARAAKGDRFTGKSGSALDIVAPAGLKAARLIVIGTGKAADRKPQDLVKLGGARDGPRALGGHRGDDAARTRRRSAEARCGGRGRARHAACAPIRSTATRPSARKATSSPPRRAVTIAVADVAARRARPGAPREAVADGVILARDLVNEPAECARPGRIRRAAPRRCSKLGVEVEVLDVKAMTKLGMGALLGVGAGLARGQPRRRVMRWNGGTKGRSAGRLHRQGRRASTPAASRSSRPPAWRT